MSRYKLQLLFCPIFFEFLHGYLPCFSENDPNASKKGFNFIQGEVSGTVGIFDNKTISIANLRCNASLMLLGKYSSLNSLSFLGPELQINQLFGITGVWSIQKPFQQEMEHNGFIGFAFAPHYTRKPFGCSVTLEGINAYCPFRPVESGNGPEIFSRLLKPNVQINIANVFPILLTLNLQNTTLGLKNSSIGVFLRPFLPGFLSRYEWGLSQLSFSIYPHIRVRLKLSRMQKTSLGSFSVQKSFMEYYDFGESFKFHKTPEISLPAETDPAHAHNDPNSTINKESPNSKKTPEQDRRDSQSNTSSSTSNSPTRDLGTKVKPKEPVHGKDIFRREKKLPTRPAHAHNDPNSTINKESPNSKKTPEQDRRDSQSNTSSSTSNSPTRDLGTKVKPKEPVHGKDIFRREKKLPTRPAHAHNDPNSTINKESPNSKKTPEQDRRDSQSNTSSSTSNSPTRDLGTKVKPKEPVHGKDIFRREKKLPTVPAHAHNDPNSTINKESPNSKKTPEQDRRDSQSNTSSSTSNSPTRDLGTKVKPKEPVHGKDIFRREKKLPTVPAHAHNDPNSTINKESPNSKKTPEQDRRDSQSNTSSSTSNSPTRDLGTEVEPNEPDHGKGIFKHEKEIQLTTKRTYKVPEAPWTPETWEVPAQRIICNAYQQYLSPTKQEVPISEIITIKDFSPVTDGSDFRIPHSKGKVAAIHGPTALAIISETCLNETMHRAVLRQLNFMVTGSDRKRYEARSQKVGSGSSRKFNWPECFEEKPSSGSPEQQLEFPDCPGELVTLNLDRLYFFIERMKANHFYDDLPISNKAFESEMRQYLESVSSDFIPVQPGSDPTYAELFMEGWNTIYYSEDEFEKLSLPGEAFGWPIHTPSNRRRPSELKAFEMLQTLEYLGDFYSSLLNASQEHAEFRHYFLLSPHGETPSSKIKGFLSVLAAAREKAPRFEEKAQQKRYAGLLKALTHPFSKLLDQQISSEPPLTLTTGTTYRDLDQQARYFLQAYYLYHTHNSIVDYLT